MTANKWLIGLFIILQNKVIKQPKYINFDMLAVYGKH